MANTPKSPPGPPQRPAPQQTPQRPAPQQAPPRPATAPSSQPGHPMNQPPAYPPNQPAPGQTDTSSPSPLPPHQAGAVTQQPDPSVVSRPPYTHPTTVKDELPPAPIEQHPIREAEYQRPIPKPGDRDWVAGSPATDYEADATEKEAKARLAAGKGIYEEYGHPIDYEERAGEEGRDEAGRIQSPDRDTQARLRYEDEVRRATEAAGTAAEQAERDERRDERRRAGPDDRDDDRRYGVPQEHEDVTRERREREARERDTRNPSRR